MKWLPRHGQLHLLPWAEGLICPHLMISAGYRALEKLHWKKPQLHPTTLTHIQSLGDLYVLKNKPPFLPLL